MTLLPSERVESDQPEGNPNIIQSYLSVIDDSSEDFAEAEEKTKSCEAYSDAILIGLCEESQ
jgi:hypothetical protein